MKIYIDPLLVVKDTPKCHDIREILNETETSSFPSILPSSIHPPLANILITKPYHKVIIE
jgi:hypothetical protein